MATLSRPKDRPENILNPFISTTIPSPFPSASEREQLLNEELLEELAAEEVHFLESLDFQRSLTEQNLDNNANQDAVVESTQDLVPSIAYVQRSCIMTLNNLLSVPTRWNPIVPDRRHSMPSSQTVLNSQSISDQPLFALQTLLANLRNREAEPDASQTDREATELDLIYELQARVQSLSSSLDRSDASLAQGLVSLLTHFNRLSSIQSHTPMTLADGETNNNALGTQSSSSTNPFDTLSRQLSYLQLERSSQTVTLAGLPPPLVVEAALLWAKIDEELERVVTMCKERTVDLQHLSLTGNLPPLYDADDYEFEHPPDYDFETGSFIDDHKPRRVRSSSTSVSEKMRLDLEGVSMAIDRLYMVVPQLQNQRVELKSSKLEQMERARSSGAQIRQKSLESADVRELDGIIGLLDKASERRLTGQSVILEGGMKAKLEKARLRDEAKREAFVETLIERSSSGRLLTQDAILQSPRTKNPDTMLTLPEFIREAVPNSSRMADPRALLTLPEFFQEPIPDHLLPPATPPEAIQNQKRTNRRRSVSAPPLSWFLPSGSKLPHSLVGDEKTKHPSSSSVRGLESMPAVRFDVHYVAENHENLRHVLVFLDITGAVPGVDIEAVVLPSPSSHLLAMDAYLVVKNGSNSSLPISLPGRCEPGKKAVKVQGGHFEVKITTFPSETATLPPSVPLLDASQLSNSLPTSFICASCSLPLVQSSKVHTYLDLPSEHWEELVDAWMCHTDQTLHEHVAKHGRGFWPETNQALVGGSYILFEQSAIVQANTILADQNKRVEDWRLVRCICGAITGRFQEHIADDRPKTAVYRLLKFAIRPVSPTADPIKVPLSAFIVEDMMEFVHAHATYRFVVFDEEEERPRLLIWLFKPNLRLAYKTPTQYAIPKTGSILAAKVLYKIIGPAAAPEDLKNILGRYPGFPQAEYLFYPISVCRRISGILKESTSAYPESMRTMTGLSVGWLQRA